MNLWYIVLVLLAQNVPTVHLSLKQLIAKYITGMILSNDYCLTRSLLQSTCNGQVFMV